MHTQIRKRNHECVGRVFVRARVRVCACMYPFPSSSCLCTRVPYQRRKPAAHRPTCRYSMAWAIARVDGGSGASARNDCQQQKNDNK